jgi:tyrosinase
MLTLNTDSMVVSLGPTSMASYRGLPKNPKSDGTGVNKRCLRRDINKNAALGATADRAYKLLNESKNIDSFYNTLLGTPPPRNDPYPWGVCPPSPVSFFGQEPKELN